MTERELDDFMAPSGPLEVWIVVFSTVFMNFLALALKNLSWLFPMGPRWSEGPYFGTSCWGGVADVEPDGILA